MSDEKNIRDFIDNMKNIETEISKHIIGQKELVQNVLIAIIAGGNVLLEGVPGLGKTKLVKTIGKVLNLEFSRIQFTPDLMPADIVGTNVMSKSESGDGVFKFQKGPVFSNIILADEINRATPKTQSAMLEAMQEQTVTVGNTTYELPKPYFVLATQNPIEMDGTYPLPEAQMDRFLFKLNVPFPSLDELKDIVLLTTKKDEEELKSVISGDELLKMRDLAREIPISESVINYAMKLILSTHPESDLSPDYAKKYITYGSSPRGAQAIIKTAKIKAVLEGRYNVSYDDIEFVAYSVLRHRIFINFEGVSEGITVEDMISRLIETTDKG
jgi:MoxR-like ATPase